MFASILPDAVRVSFQPDDEPVTDLFPVERKWVAGAVGSRQGEFAAGRACARDALAQLGIYGQPVPVGRKGEPIWPCGVVGSITHCQGLRACAVARSSDLITIGIDAEPNDRLPRGVALRDICISEEVDRLGALSIEAPTARVHWDRLIFCMKEAVYKAWYPLTRSWLGFDGVSITVDPTGRKFHARLLVEGLRIGERELRSLNGRWNAVDGHLLVAIAIPHSIPADD